MLSQNEFNILYFLSNSDLQSDRKHYTLVSPQFFEQLTSVTNLSLSDLKTIYDHLELKGYVSEQHLTKDGFDSLEPYKVDNAVIMAAGFSSRFVPLCYEQPKGLLPVMGEVLIERQIKQLQAAGIHKIYVVAGYKKEMFTYLEKAYGVHIVINEQYAVRNNHSTLYAVKDLLKNSYICSSDNYFTQNVFTPYVYRPYYSAVYASGETSEYCLSTDYNDRITNVRIGGANSWYMLGHVYFDAAFSEKLMEYIVAEYDLPETQQMLWENIYMKHLDTLNIYMKRYEDDIILEFDSLEDLRNFDHTYIDHSGSYIMEDICSKFGCQEHEITNLQVLSSSSETVSFTYDINGRTYCYKK